MNKSTRKTDDDVEYHRRWLISCTMTQFVNYIYPKIYDLSSFENFEEEYKDAGNYSNTTLIIPDTLPCNKTLLENDKIYLIDNGQFFYIWLGKNFTRFDEFFEGENGENDENENFDFFGNWAEKPHLFNLKFSWENQKGRFCHRLFEHLNTIYNGPELTPYLLLER